MHVISVNIGRARSIEGSEKVGETGIFNLTKDESPALIHIGKDKTQQWTLVRLQQPQAKDAQR